MTRVMRITVYCTFALGIINIAFCLTRYLTIKLSGSIDELSLTVVSMFNIPTHYASSFEDQKPRKN